MPKRRRLSRRVLRRFPNKVSVRPLDRSNRADIAFLRYICHRFYEPWVEDEEEIDFLMIYIASQRVGMIGIEWDYSNDGFAEGRIWLQYISPRYRSTDPWRIVIADQKESCRFNSRVTSVPHRLSVLIPLEEIEWLAKMFNAGFREISRDELVIMMIWPNDDCD